MTVNLMREHIWMLGQAKVDHFAQSFGIGCQLEILNRTAGRRIILFAAKVILNCHLGHATRAAGLRSLAQMRACIFSDVAFLSR